MGNLIPLVITSILGKITAEGKRKVSKTKVGVVGLLAVAPNWEMLIPSALSGDPGAIGTLVGIAITFALTLWGRGNKGNE